MDELGRLSQPLFDFLDRNSSAADTLSSIRGIAVTPGQVLARAAYQARLHAGGSVRVSNGSARRRGSIVVGQLEADLHCPCFHIKENQFVER
jgi:hypothetical protein